MAADQLSDEALLSGFGIGDPDASLAFVRRFQHRVFGVAVAVTRDTGAAEDVAQQAFERAWRHAQAYDVRRGTVASWLVTITRNLAIDSLRSRRVSVLGVDELLAGLAGRDDPEAAAEAADGRSRLRRALSELPSEQARALALAAFRGLTMAEVADAEGIPVGTAKTRIRAAMTKLRGAMSAVGLEP